MSSCCIDTATAMPSCIGIAATKHSCRKDIAETNSMTMLLKNLLQPSHAHVVEECVTTIPSCLIYIVPMRRVIYKYK